MVFAWSFDWRNKTGARDSNLFRAGARAYRGMEVVSERNTYIVFCLLVSRRSLRLSRGSGASGNNARSSLRPFARHPQPEGPLTVGNLLLDQTVYINHVVGTAAVGRVAVAARNPSPNDDTEWQQYVRSSCTSRCSSSSSSAGRQYDIVHTHTCYRYYHYHRRRRRRTTMYGGCYVHTYTSSE